MPGVFKLLSERRPLAEYRAFPVDDINGKDEDERDTGEDCRSVRKRVISNVCTKG